jgi:uncharacterized membrane protein YuzA (DUF378 family)
MGFLDNPNVRTALMVVVIVGALNWGLVEFLDFGLIQDGLGFSSGSTEYQATVGVIAASAVAKGFVLFEEM